MRAASARATTQQAAGNARQRRPGVQHLGRDAVRGRLLAEYAPGRRRHPPRGGGTGSPRCCCRCRCHSHCSRTTMTTTTTRRCWSCWRSWSSPGPSPPTGQLRGCPWRPQRRQPAAVCPPTRARTPASAIVSPALRGTGLPGWRRSQRPRRAGRPAAGPARRQRAPRNCSPAAGPARRPGPQPAPAWRSRVPGSETQHSLRPKPLWARTLAALACWFRPSSCDRKRVLELN